MPINRADTPEERAILGRSVREKDPARTHRKRELNGLRSGATMLDDFVEDRHLPTDVVNARSLASGSDDSDRAVDSEHVRREAIHNGHINDMDGGKLHGSSVSDGKLEEDYSRDGHSHSQYITESEHDDIHSFTYYVKYPREERQEMLEKREALRSAEPLDYEFSERNFNRLVEQVEILKANLEVALQLQMDYRNMDAFERERRFDDPEWSDWSKKYKQVYEVDEYFEESLPRVLDIEGRVRKHHWDAIEFVEHEHSDGEEE